MPTIGACTARRTFQVASTPTGRSAVPAHAAGAEAERRPAPLDVDDEAGDRVHEREPVGAGVDGDLRRVARCPAASARASRTAAGASRARARARPARSAAGSAPNSIPPAFTFGTAHVQLEPVERARRVRRATARAARSPRRTPRRRSRRRSRACAPRGARARATADARLARRRRPGFASPTALIIPPSNSATRGAGAPSRGSGLTAFVTMPAERGRDR